MLQSFNIFINMCIVLLQFQVILLSNRTPQAVKDTVADMAAMKGAILPSRKKLKHKKRKHGNPDSDGSYDGIEKVHQDDDYSKSLNHTEFDMM